MHDAEERVRAACRGGDNASATTCALDAFGGEILRFLTARLGSRSDAEDAFSLFIEDVWHGLPRFEWSCRLRRWLYIVARNAANQHVRSPHRRFEQYDSPSAFDRLPGRAEREPHATPAHERTTLRHSFERMRGELDPEAQQLLLLRLDHRLSWRDIALAMSDRAQGEPGALDQEAVRLRKSFERIKHSLRQRARQEGLFDRPEV
jgi:RNA polymerase sigma factor (sigma-70 family)